MRRSQLARHLVLMAFATSINAHSINELLNRASTCPDPSFNQCSGTGLPSNFCCPSSTTCVPLAGNTTLLCCPSGNCDQIKPLSCDLNEQNIILHPDNSLKTTALSSTMPTCGTLCCPFGYSCTSDTLCRKNADQSVAPGASTSTSSSSPSATRSSSPSSTANPSATATPSFSPINSNTTLIQTCDKFPIGAILVGFFPGLVLGILLSIASICIFGAQRRRASRRRSGSSFGNISEPQPSEHIRTDFLRKQPQTPSSTAGSTPARQGTVHRVRSLFRKSQLNVPTAMVQESPRPPMPLVINKNPHPVTPPLQRERSYENVNIFADRDTASSLRENQRQNGLKPPRLPLDVRASHQTTMDDVMGLAGLPKGQPYVYKRTSPAFTPSPKTRPS